VRKIKVLITGGNGLIGSHLAEKLTNRGDSVTLIDLAFDSNTKDFSCEKIKADIRNYDAVARVVEGNDAVFHFAAVSRVVWGQHDPQNCWVTNTMGTVNILEACRKAPSKPLVFYASSREVYGEPKSFPVPESHPKNPKSIYGTSKLAAEMAVSSYYNMLHLDSIIFRFSNVYGSERDQLKRVIPKFMIQALKGEDITLYGGDQILDFTFIDDTVSGILAAYTAAMEGSNSIIGQDFHYVTGRGVSVSELSEMIVKVANSKSEIVRIPAKDFDVLKFIGDPTKSNEILGFKARVKLEDGLKMLQERIQQNLNSPEFIARMEKA
jgi:nucleoside-diphosphate-sugar epimerase